VVAMAGYCTVAEILASGTPALLVPRTFPRREQLNRAARLAAAGRVSMLTPDELDAARVRRALDGLLDRDPFPVEPLLGAQDAAAILEGLDRSSSIRATAAATRSRRG
jgi:predicted glycosyltransferase